MQVAASTPLPTHSQETMHLSFVACYSSAASSAANFDSLVIEGAGVNAHGAWTMRGQGKKHSAGGALCEMVRTYSPKPVRAESRR